MRLQIDSEEAWAIAVGLTVRGLRKDADLTQERFAQLTSLTRNHVQKIEHGSTSVMLSSLVRISEALDVQLPALFLQAQGFVQAPDKMKAAVRQLKQEAAAGRPRKRA